MTELPSYLTVVRTQLLAAATRRIDQRRRAARRGWLLVAVASVALAGGTVAIGAGVLDDGSAKILSRDFKRIDALSPKTARNLPTVVPGRTIQAFTKADIGFDVDIVPTSGGGLCMVMRHAAAQLGTDHAETCGTRAQTRDTARPMMFTVGHDGSGAAFGVAPTGATTGIFTVRGRSLKLLLRDGFWAVRIPRPPNAPATMLAATSAVARGHASFR